MTRFRLALLLGCLLTLSAGCGSATSIKGQVTYDGKRVGNGSITFQPADGRGPSAGGEITDGQYHIDTITPGKKIAQIIAVKKVNFAASNAELARQAAENAKHGDETGIVERADAIPADAEGNNRQVEIAEGDQTLDFDLKPPKKK